MQGIVGYTIEQKIHSRVKTSVYRGLRESEGQSVIIKVLNAEYPSVGDIIQLRNQYSITKNLDNPGIIKPLALETYKNAFALILEDFGGISLKYYIASKKPSCSPSPREERGLGGEVLPLTTKELTSCPPDPREERGLGGEVLLLTIAEFLKIAIAIAAPLEVLHHNRIIHKDIKPENILINPETGIVKITDFSISSLLPRETQSLINPNSLEGTLAYISPEQTGRMNRGIDYRTDFYSLGVTFYEILTGRVPFQSEDAMELVHSHIAKQPVPPINVNPSIPLVISDIVMKLMAKTAEERYQSASGLKADLENCLNQLETNGTIETFILGQRDIFERFQIPEKLYGREAEVETLMAAFDLVSGGTTEMMLVSGYSGIGKTALVHEVHKPIVRQRGYFIAGKFDQFKRNIPFASLIQAFKDLIRQLLTESEAQVQTWRERLLAALGDNGQVIIDVIPEVELLIGKQPAVSELGPTESQNRFNRVFQNFIRVFAGAEHPLVIFLDDLQWADSASLKLIQLLMTDPDTKYMFLIGAYRDNEVSPVHPLMVTLENITKADAIVNNIVLQPLDLANLNRLVADALSCPEERAKPLSELVFQKTEGNPFFATQFLKSLYDEGLLEYQIDPPQPPLKRGELETQSSLASLVKGGAGLTGGYWRCDIAKVKALAVSDNVVEFMANQLAKLPESAREVLKLAACIGNQFDLETLAIARDKSAEETAADLWKALQSGLVLPLSEDYKFFQAESESHTRNPVSGETGDRLSVSYKFLHDRVQQAAYSLIPEADKKATHLKIGRLLLKNTSFDDIEEKIFELVNQLNIGVDLIASQSEKYQLAHLNLIAGRKAKSATAYEPAVRYLNVGLGLLPADSWTHQYDTALALHVEAVEAEYLNINFERAKQLSVEVLQQAKDLLEKVKVYELQIQFYTAQNQPHAAINTGLEVLKMLGVILPTKPKEMSVCAARLREELSWGSKQISDLADLPVMTDPYQLAVMRILAIAASAAYHTNPALLQLIVFTMVGLCIKYGNSSLAAFAYSYYGVLLCGVYRDIDSGYQFGHLAVAVLEKFNARELEAKVIDQFNVFVRHWKEHARAAIQPFQKAIESGIETGDIEYAFYGAIDYCNQLYFVGEMLEYVNQKQVQYLEIMRKLKLEFHIYYCQIGRQMVLNLLGKSADPRRLVGESLDESKMLPVWKEENNLFFVFCIYCCKLLLLYFFKEYSEAVEVGRLGEKYEKVGGGMLYVAEYNFYYSLALLANSSNGDSDGSPLANKKRALRKVAERQKKMKHWASHAPANFQHKYDLVEAEKARVLGNIRLAMELYDRAIASAKETGYIQEEALANELAAEFYLALGIEKIAQTYLTDAYYCYARWGAIAKVQDLETRYPQLLAILTASEPTGSVIPAETISIASTRTITSTTTGSSAVLDLATVIKASIALSSEIVLDKLLANLMRVILENAGAQKGFMIMENKGKLVIEAAGVSDIEEVAVRQSIPIETSDRLPVSMINYVARTQESVVLNDAADKSIFAEDSYIQLHQPKSVLCTPILGQGKLIGILYLENNLTKRAFSPERLEVLKILSSQAAISLENAQLYEAQEEYSRTLEVKVEERTQELKSKNEQLIAAQKQMLAQEKLAYLGSLTAGIAHEIRNPLNFVNNFAAVSVSLTQDLREEIENQSEQLDAEAVDYINDILNDLAENMAEITRQGQRADVIIQSMLSHSRSESGHRQLTDLNALLAESVGLAYHGWRTKSNTFNITIETGYDESVGQVDVVPQDISRAFLNIIDNACYAAIAHKKVKGEEFSPLLSVRTRNLGEAIEIRIRDNGEGIPQDVQDKIFNPFFTTKPTGEGTGLGLSLTYDIIVGQHQGEIKVETEPGVYTEFIVILPKKVG